MSALLQNHYLCGYLPNYNQSLKNHCWQKKFKSIWTRGPFWYTWGISPTDTCGYFCVDFIHPKVVSVSRGDNSLGGKEQSWIMTLGRAVEWWLNPITHKAAVIHLHSLWHRSHVGLFSSCRDRKKCLMNFLPLIPSQGSNCKYYRIATFNSGMRKKLGKKSYFGNIPQDEF